jgi:agmatinase
MRFDPDQCPPADAGIFGLPFTSDESRLVLVPVPWDATTSYRPGTRLGPAAIRQASHQLDLYDVELGEPWRAGIAMLAAPEGVEILNGDARGDAERVIEVGGRIGRDTELSAALDRVNALGARLNDIVYRAVDAQLAHGKLVGVVGGDHSVPFGAIQRVAEANREIGILHIDAHADLRVAYEGFTWSHASIMHNVLEHVPQVKRIVQVGIRDLCKAEADRIASDTDRIATHFDMHIAARMQAGVTWSALADSIVDDLPERVYISFDIDGLQPTFCPNTGTPVPGGLDFHQACALIRKVVERGRKIVGFDLNEVAPGADGNEWDANVGARVLYKLCGWALRSWT